MITYTYYCDGCGRKMSEEASYTSALQLAQRANQTELFCPDSCQKHCAGYWEEKRSVVEDAVKTMESKVRKHREAYFKRKSREAKQLKAVSV